MVNDRNDLSVYEIWQLRDDLDDDVAHSLYFRSYQTLKDTGLDVDRENYELVWKELWNGEGLNYLYEKFNLNHPDEYKGRSMSISDVVVFKKHDEIAAFYVDKCGFEPIDNWNENAIDKGFSI